MTQTGPSQWAVPVQAARNTVRALGLLARGATSLPRTNVGARWRFADGSTSRIYRETVVSRAPAAEPVVLVTRFQARSVDTEAAHERYERRSAVILPILIGQPGFLSKLWFGHDDGGWYRGVHEFDGAGQADQYAGLLARLLSPVIVPGSIEHHLLRDCTRASLMQGAGGRPSDVAAWWCPDPTDLRAAPA